MFMMINTLVSKDPHLYEQMKSPIGSEVNLYTIMQNKEGVIDKDIANLKFPHSLFSKQILVIYKTTVMQKVPNFALKFYCPKMHD